MENKKRKWEREYEQYSNSTELDDRIEYLQDLINRKVATKDEYEGHKKVTAIKANLPKVKNILELRGKLDGEIKEIKAELAKRELSEKIDKAIIVLDDEMKKLEEEKIRLEKEIKDNPEKKAELQTKLAENEKKIQENNVKFGKCHEEKKKESKNAEKSKFKDITTEDLKAQSAQISMNISKCNLACNKLMQGFSWKSIEVALDKFENEKLTAKGKETAKMKQNREAAKAANEKQEAEKAIANLTKFQKFKNWAKNLWDKATAPFFEEDEKEQSEGPEKEEAKAESKEEKPKFWQKVKAWFKGEDAKTKTGDKGKDDSEKESEPKTPEKEPTKEDTFRQYLRQVAEKRIDGIEQEKLDAEKAEKEARRKAAIEKLKANREGKDTGAKITKLDKEDDGR